MIRYIGITIGPIFDTIKQATKPAALWFCSSFFSDVTRRLCEKIIDQFDDAVIYSPYYNQNMEMDDGVGKFHDRILFYTEKYEVKVMEQILGDVKSEVCDNFSTDLCGDKKKEYVRDYLQIHYIAMEKEMVESQGANVVLALSPYLDTLELMKSFPANNDYSPFKKVCFSEDPNQHIKESKLYRKIDPEKKKRFEQENRSIRSIEDIASCDDRLQEDRKLRGYFAVVSADGDGMGKYLQKLNNDALTKFSQVCFHYDQKAAKSIEIYGGMTIYAGGDDLLFLAPVENDCGQTIFELCGQIQQDFHDLLAQCSDLPADTELPTLSFGVSVQYKKYPLYEALEKSRDMLNVAKGYSGNRRIQKNNITFSLQKHSGQSLELMIQNTDIDKLTAILRCGVEDEDMVLRSVLYTLTFYKDCLILADSNVKSYGTSYENYEKIWENLFDNAGQEFAKDYIRKLCEIYYDEFLMKNPGFAMGENQKDEDDTLSAFLTCLKIKKFMLEKGDER